MLRAIILGSESPGGAPPAPRSTVEGPSLRRAARPSSPRFRNKGMGLGWTLGVSGRPSAASAEKLAWPGPRRRAEPLDSDPNSGFWSVAGAA